MADVHQQGTLSSANAKFRHNLGINISSKTANFVDVTIRCFFSKIISCQAFGSQLSLPKGHSMLSNEAQLYLKISDISRDIANFSRVMMGPSVGRISRKLSISGWKIVADVHQQGP